MRINLATGTLESNANLRAAGMRKPQHYALHHPHTPDGCGYQVCSCGATRQIVRGIPLGGWHTCNLCTHQSWETWADHNEDTE